MSEDRKQYIRFHKRDKKGKPWLNDIELEACKTGLSLQQAIDKILENVAKEKAIGHFINR